MWVFSQETLAQVPEAYAIIQHTDYSHYFPEWTRQISFFSVPLWRWMSILLFIALAFVSASLLTRTVLWMLELLLKKKISGDVKASDSRTQVAMFFSSRSQSWFVSGGGMQSPH